MSQEETPKIQDQCPDWADSKIMNLRQVEIFLGNIPKTANWKSDHLNKISGEEVRSNYPGLSDATADMLFSQISRQLSSEGYSHDQIATFVNSRISYEGGPSYCSAKEVSEAISENS